ncbi:MAG TPA: NYN domain-containing protein [Ktedonobacterales bacterium]
MLRLRWRFFWSRRSATRTLLALVLALVALLSSLYLAFPAIGQRQILDGLLAAFQGVAALGAEPLLAIVIVTCFACSLALIFVPSYRRHSYLATTPSIIPPVSVYFDAENQLSTSTIRPFRDFLVKHLDGRRADLLYFLDASRTAPSRKYKALYLAGFRPVDVPHDPTGMGEVKEAVDRELAMHAYERALLGPPGQEFIIVSGDADFVPLIYRLVALGHRVQIWAAHIPAAYREVKSYLDIDVIDLSQRIPELKIVPQPLPPANPSLPVAKSPLPVAKPTLPSSKQKRRRPRVAAPVSLTQPGEKQLYYAVAETVAAHAEALRRFTIDNARNLSFHSLMRGTYGTHMPGVGYNVGNWLDYWLEHLIVLGVLLKAKGLAFPQRGSTKEEDAARSLFALSEAAAKEAVAIAASHEDGQVLMKEVAAALAASGSSFEGGAATLLRRISANSGRRIVSARYFVRSARALGLLAFEDVPESLDTIAHPRLPDTPTAP